MMLSFFEITTPVFLTVLAGFSCVQAKILTQKTTRVLSLIVFYFLLPATIFLHISKISLDELLQWSYILAYFISSIILTVLTIFISKQYFNRNNAEVVINVMAS